MFKLIARRIWKDYKEELKSNIWDNYWKSSMNAIEYQFDEDIKRKIDRYAANSARNVLREQITHRLTNDELTKKLINDTNFIDTVVKAIKDKQL